MKVQAAGVCLSDVHLVEGLLKTMRLTGDEVGLGQEVSCGGEGPEREEGTPFRLVLVPRGPARTGQYSSEWSPSRW